MSIQDPHGNDLGTALGRAMGERADRLGTTHVDLDAVRGRAAGIRRRRRAAGAVGVLAAAAVLVPTGLVAGGVLGGAEERERDLVAGQGPRDREQVFTPVGEVEVASLDDLPDGDAARVPYVSAADGLVLPGVTFADGEDDAVRMPQNAVAVSAGWLATGIVDGQAVLGFLDPDGVPVEELPLVEAGVVAAPAPLEQAAWIEPLGDDQRVVLADTSGGNPFLAELASWTVPGTVRVDLVGVGPQGVVVEVEGDAEGRTEPALLVPGTAEPVAVEGLLGVAGVDAVTGRLSGTTEVGDDGSCSAVTGPQGGTPIWETCDWTLGAFSPDGRWISATQPYRSGFGDTVRATLDGATGDVQASWSSIVDPDLQVTFSTYAWESEDDQLVVLVQGLDSVVARFSPDGTVEVVDRGQAEEFFSDIPFFLPLS